MPVIIQGYFCAAMRKIAFLLFMVFATVQLAPAAMAVFTDITAIFVADEEREDEENKVENKAKKDYSAYSSHAATHTQKLNIAFHLAEKIHPSPCMEKLSPPPNFC